MYKKITVVALMAVFCFLMTAPSSFGERKRLAKPSQRSFEVEPATFAIVPHLSLGNLVGDAADRMESFFSDLRSSDKLIYAGGVTLEYMPRKRWAVHTTAERVSKDLPGNLPTISGWTLGAGFQFRPMSAGRRSPFLKVEGGHIWASADGYDDAGENYWQVGVGLFDYTTPTTNLRFEIFYRSIMSSDNGVFSKIFRSDGFDIEYIGVDFGVGFNL